MKIQPAAPCKNGYSPIFGHTFKVSICVRESEKSAYQFVNPISNKVLYQKLTSRLVYWLNHDYITRLRALMGQFRKKASRILSERDKIGKQKIRDLLAYLDTDYKKHQQVRSVYTNDGLAYLASGDDIKIIKEVCGAENIGIEKHYAKENFGNERTTEVKEAISDFKSKSVKYVKDSTHLLRSPNSERELMLRLNFIQTGTKKNEPVYEFDNFDFYAINSSLKK